MGFPANSRKRESAVHLCASFNFLWGQFPAAFQTFESLSLPNASIGGSTGLTTDETVTRALMKTFGGDNFGINSHKCFLILRPVLRGDSFDGSESAAKVRPEN